MQRTFNDRVAQESRQAKQDQFVLPMFVVRGVEDWWVDILSAGINFDSDHTREVRGMHRSIVKPKHKGDDAYKWVLSNIHELLKQRSQSGRQASKGVSQRDKYTAYANRILENHACRFVDPTLVRLDADPEEELAEVEKYESSDNSFSVSTISAQDVVSIFSDPTQSGGRTVIVVGGAGLGKSRIAAEIAADLLRCGKPCIYLRRREIRSLFQDVDNPTELLRAYLHQHYEEEAESILSEQRAPIIIDGWNEIDYLLINRPIYRAMVEIISGFCPFPVVFTSRRIWWEAESDWSLVKSKPEIYRLELFNDEQRTQFIENQGLSAEDLINAAEVAGIGEICRRPFFLEKAVELKRLASNCHPRARN